MYYIVYETTNLINGKVYRGCHKTPNLDDGYLGSGKLLKLAIRKYGSQNFKRTILCFCETEEDMYQTEMVYVDEAFVSDDNTYNLRCGGLGGRMSMELREQVSIKLRKPKTSETKRKMKESQTGKKLSDETKQKISKSSIGKKHSNSALLFGRRS